MIVAYDSTGKIFHIVKDPVPEGLHQSFMDAGMTFIDVPPKKVVTKVKDPITGETKQSIEQRPIDCDIKTHHVVDGKLQERPHLEIEMRAENKTLYVSGVPEGSEVQLDLFVGTPLETSQSFTADGEQLELEFDEAGKARIRVSGPWPYQEELYEVEVV